VNDWTPEQLELLTVALDLGSDQAVTFVDSGTLSPVHPEQACSGRYTWIHKPSEHPLASASVVRDERRQTVYRVCEHPLLQRTRTTCGSVAGSAPTMLEWPRYPPQREL